MKITKYFKNLFSIERNSLHCIIRLFGAKIKIKVKFKIDLKIYDYDIEKNKIFIYSSTNSYACNPKYIAEEILKRNLPYQIVWGLHCCDSMQSIPDKIKTVAISNYDEYLKEFASSKILIFNMRANEEINLGLVKKPNQIYINTWHGSLGIKKVGSDINHLKKHVLKSTKIDAEQVDYLISNSDFTSKIHKSSFLGNGKILKIGHPRNDVFFGNLCSVKAKIFQTYKIPAESNVVLYAPTFRDKQYNVDVYDLDTKLLRQALFKRFGGKWVVLMRLHPEFRVLDKKFDFRNDNGCIDVTMYPDMQELLAASDTVITDYSSCIYDFMLTRRPGFIYATDIENYNNNRGFYYPLESTPFPIATDSQRLADNIINFDMEKYHREVEQFLKDKGCIDDGHASERIVDFIEKIINS